MIKKKLKPIVKILLIIVNRLFVFNKRRVLFFDCNSTTYVIVIKCLFKYKIYFLPNYKEYFDWGSFTHDNYRGEENRIYNLRNRSIDYLVRHGIERVVIDKDTRDNLWLHIVLQTAMELEIKIIYVDHGTTGEIFEGVNYHRLRFADVYYATNTELREYYQGEARRFGFNTVLKEWDRPRPKKRKRGYDSKFILVATQFNSGELNVELYPDTLRYKHNKRVALALQPLMLGTNRINRVVWKTLPTSEDFEDPMVKWLARECKGIEIETRGNFNKLIRECGIFITDCVSTTFYDAVEIGVPTYAFVYSKGNKVRGKVLKTFENQIIQYDDINFAVIIMCKLIESKLKGYISYIPKVEHNVDRFEL